MKAVLEENTSLLLTLTKPKASSSFTDMILASDYEVDDVSASAFYTLNTTA
jgi:hypothetical protein